jgi:hypothetical protein
MDNQESVEKPRKKVIATRDVLQKIYSSSGIYRGTAKVGTEYYYTDKSSSDLSSEGSSITMREKTGQRVKTPTQPPPVTEKNVTAEDKQPEQSMITVHQDEKDGISRTCGRNGTG